MTSRGLHQVGKMASPALPEEEEVVEGEVGAEEGEQEHHSLQPAGRREVRMSQPPDREGLVRQPARISMEVITVITLKELPNVTFVAI